MDCFMRLFASALKLVNNERRDRKKKRQREGSPIYPEHPIDD
jgi:hypothetical protein